VLPYPSIFTLHYRHQYQLALEPESQLPSGRPRRSLDTGVAAAKLFHIGDTSNDRQQPSSVETIYLSTFDCNMGIPTSAETTRLSRVDCILSKTAAAIRFTTPTPTYLLASRLSVVQTEQVPAYQHTGHIHRRLRTAIHQLSILPLWKTHYRH
jgi:hypothetical protein